MIFGLFCDNRDNSLASHMRKLISQRTAHQSQSSVQLFNDYFGLNTGPVTLLFIMHKSVTEVEATALQFIFSPIGYHSIHQLVLAAEKHFVYNTVSQRTIHIWHEKLVVDIATCIRRHTSVYWVHTITTMASWLGNMWLCMRVESQYRKKNKNYLFEPNIHTEICVLLE